MGGCFVVLNVEDAPCLMMEGAERECWLPYHTFAPAYASTLDSLFLISWGVVSSWQQG